MEKKGASQSQMEGAQCGAFRAEVAGVGGGLPSSNLSGPKDLGEVPKGPAESRSVRVHFRHLLRYGEFVQLIGKSNYIFKV